jgi:Heavy metal binding domain
MAAFWPSRCRNGTAMNHKREGDQIYLCPMHRNVRQPSARTCPKCGMDLVPEGARFANVSPYRQPCQQNPVTALTMAAVMVALMIAILHL